MKSLIEMDKRREAATKVSFVQSAEHLKRLITDHERMSKALKKAIDILKERHAWADESGKYSTLEGICLRDIQSILEGKNES